MSSANIPYVEELKRRNEQCRDAWNLHEGHRAQVTRLLREAAGEAAKPRRLAALGAGNCNDLDLAALLGDFDELHLVDLDAAALRDGVARQHLDKATTIKKHGRMDVTGCLSQLAADLHPDNADDERIQSWIAKINALPAFPQPSPFNVVVSLCLLTQVSEIALLLVGGPKHPRGNDLLFALRNHHLRKLLEMTRPGGITLLLTDIVSSFTFPNLTILNESDLANAMYQQVALKNFFTGTNPYALESRFKQEPTLNDRVASVEILAPWRWNQGNRTLLVSGLKIRTK